MMEISHAACPYCGEDVTYLWDNGVIPSDDCDLIGDSLYHNSCWNKICQEFESERKHGLSRRRKE